MEESLGYRVKRERIMAGLTQDELAQNLNVLDSSGSKINRGMVSKWENNRETPSLDNLRKLSRFFGRSMDYFAVSDDVYINGLGSAISDSIKKADLSTAQAAKEIGVYESDLVRYENGDPISLSVAKDFADKITFWSYYDFLNEYGLYDEYIPPVFDGDADRYEQFKKAVEDDYRSESLESRRTSVQQIPLLGTIAAGTPVLAEEHVEEYVTISIDIKADFALRIKGDSMIDANIYDGDIVFIRQQPTVENGEIAAVRIIDPDTSDARATLKRVYKTPEGLMLLSENKAKAYPPIVVDKDTCDGAKILGKAIKYVTDIR